MTVLPSLLLCFGLGLWTVAVRATKECGGTLTSLTGTIQSPNFPNNYADRLNCSYVITAPDKYRITLTFTSLDVEAGVGCLFDYVEVKDGGTENSPSLGRFCNTSLPKARRTFTNRMLIKFVTDGSKARPGFQATYTSALYPDSFFLMTSSGRTTYGGQIFRMDTETRSNYNIRTTSTVYNPIAVDYDPVDQKIYWTEVGVLRQIRSSFLNGSGVRTVMDGGADATLDGMAVDPLSRLIVYTDAGRKLIGILTLTLSTPGHKTVVNTSLDKPRAIVLDTAKGVMFWSDWGAPAKIERANYDGSDRRTLVSYYLLHPNALALDVANNRLYWADAGTDMVEMSDMDGNGRTALLHAGSGHHFFGLTLFQNSLYITDWGTSGTKTTKSLVIRQPLPRGNATVFGVVGARLNDIHVYHHNLPGTSPNGCGDNNGGCRVICIPLPSNSSKCMCPDGKSLSSDRQSCVEGLPPTTTLSTTTVTTTSTATSTTTENIITTTTSSRPLTTTTTTTTTPTPTPTPATITTTDVTEDITTPRFSDVAVVVLTSEPMPFDTDGLEEMTLTCDLEEKKVVKWYSWNVDCRDQTDNQCVFAPQLAKDDGKMVSCTVAMLDGRLAVGVLELELDYPPPQPPTIHGYRKDDVLQEDSSLIMTCFVNGGKPLVTSVIFTCDGHPDTSPDIVIQNEVHSYLTFAPVRAEDDGKICVCTAVWKKTDWYRLSATTTLRVNETEASKLTAPNVAVIGGAVAGGVVVVIIMIIIIIVIIKRRGSPVYDKPEKKRANRQENQYTGLGEVKGQPFVNQAFSCEMADNGCASHYSEIEDNERNSIYAEVGEVADAPAADAARPDPLGGDYLHPVPCSWQVEKGYIHPIANPSHQYMNGQSQP